MIWYWISTKVFTAGFYTDTDGIVKGGAPIIRKWIGAHVNKVKKAYEKYPETIIEKLG